MDAAARAPAAEVSGAGVPARVAVVILNWNAAEMTRRCLEVARAACAEPVHWIVVDNGSAAPIGGLGEDVTVIRNAENLGFAGGVNVGLRRGFGGGAEHVWLLNNDAEPLAGSLARLLEVARADARVGLASPVVLNLDMGDAIDWCGGIWRDGIYEKTRDPAEFARWEAQWPERVWLVGTALLVSRRLIERIGYFDEKLFAYYEDNDMSRRSAAAGFRNVLVADAAVRHHSGNLKERPGERPPYYYYLMVRNELLLLRKTRERAAPFYWALRRIRRLYRGLRGHPAQRRAIRRGVVDAVLGRGGPYPG